MNRIFLLSPAHSGGKRAAMLLRPQAQFDLASRVRSGAATLGEVFAFCSGLYFRGKLAYARRFAKPPCGIEGVQIITTSRGLVPAHSRVGSDTLREFAAVEVDLAEPRFVNPLMRSAEELARTGAEVVLLGSIATAKYVDCLLPVLGERLVFPSSFVGRGDMSRGALLLQCAAAFEELRYTPLAGAVLRGRRVSGLVIPKGGASVREPRPPRSCPPGGREKPDAAISRRRSIP